MLCDNSKEREVEIHLTKVENDTKVTLHLCKQCAQVKGFETGDSILKSPLGGFIQAMGKGGASLLPTPADGLRCSACGATLRDFRESGRLGCAQCYESFETHLRDLLRRLHGSSQHVGERYILPGAGERPPGRSGHIPAGRARAGRPAAAARAAPGEQGAGGAGPRGTAAAGGGAAGAGARGGDGE